MDIDLSKCVGCGNCVPFCTMGVISIENYRAVVNEDECVECSTCYRSLRDEGLNPTLVRIGRALLRNFPYIPLIPDPPVDVCPTGALVEPKLDWPRVIRREFSNPVVIHPSTEMSGRGTMEIKTNEVTGRLGEGDVGMVIELGRPGLGVFLRDIEKMAMAVAARGAVFERNNPLTVLMEDPIRGRMRPDVLGEKVLSAIIELRCREEQVEGIVEAMRQVERELGTVGSAGIASRCRKDGSIPHLELAEKLGLELSLNGKTNLGLGRPLFEETAQ